MNNTYKTRKLYYGFPIFIIGYKDNENSYNITTSSSSYSLGEMLVVGVSTESNVAKQVKISKRLSLNLLGEEELGLIEYAGYNHNKNKLVDNNISYEINHDVPVLLQSQISIIARVEESVEFDGYINFICRIEERLYQDKLIENDKIDYEKIKPIIYAGDDKKRVYKTVNEKGIETGVAIKTTGFKKL